MKHILTATILIATAFTLHADDKSIAQKTHDAAETIADKTTEMVREAKGVVFNTSHRAERAARAAWNKTKAYVSDETPVYRTGANEGLAGLGREIAEVKAQTPSDAPTYFNTRLLALDQEREHLAKTLALMTPKEIQNRTSRARLEYDRCVTDLESAIDQAQEGVEMLFVLSAAKTNPTQ